MGVRRLLICAMLIVVAALATCLPAQEAGENPGDGDPLESHGVFLSEQRALGRKLERAEQFLAQGRYGEAILLLDGILAGDEDWFYAPRGERHTHRSIKGRAEQLIGSLPAAGRETYALQVGAPAARLLADSAARGDMQGIAEVFRRYFHTQAGYEASLLLAYHDIDSGRFQPAARRLDQLASIPQAARRFEPTLSALSALCWKQLGDSASADRALDRIASAVAARPLRTGELRLQDAAQLRPWLAGSASAGLPEPPGTSARHEWAMYRGDPSRSAASQGGRPLVAARWRVRTANHPTLERFVEQIQQAYLSRDLIALPCAQPLAVGNQVLMRTARHVIAVDLESGKRIWEADRPSVEDPLDQLLVAGRNRGPSAGTLQLGLGLQQRMWEDAVFGRLASDGRNLYAIEDLGLLGSASDRRLLFLGAPQAGGLNFEEPHSSNTLVCYSITDRGRIVWQADGSKPIDKSLTDAFFLGVPLLADGDLYVLVEAKSGIRLAVLEPETGRLRWSQQLVNLERSIAQDPIRRLVGATPSLAGGVLVCPTTAGTVIGIDPLRRTFRWAYRYRPRSAAPVGPMAIVTPAYPALLGRSGGRWIDATAILASGRALLTPPDSDLLHCLDLEQGTLHWTIARENFLFIGCVEGESAVLVGEDRLMALRLKDGQPAWQQPIVLARGSRPSGQGFHSHGFYYLPLSSAEVVKIDIERGEIVERARSREGIIPGNLICHGDNVISLSAGAAEAYHQVEPLRSKTQALLAADPDNADALARQGELSLEDGDLAAAVSYLQRSFALAPKPLTRELLAMCLFEALRQDFAAYQNTVAQVEQLIDQPEQRMELLRLVARGYEKSGRSLDAFDAYLKLLDEEPDAKQLMQVDTQLSVRTDRYLAGRLLALRSESSGEDAARIDERVAARRGQVEQNPDEESLRRFLSYFGQHPGTDAIKIELARRLVAREPSIECEMILRELESSSRPESVRAAVVLMAELLLKSHCLEDARQYVERLRGELAETVCLNGETGQQILHRLFPEQATAGSVDRPWPQGAVRVSMSRPEQSGLLRRRALIHLEYPAGPFLDRMTLSVDQHMTQSLVGQDVLGIERFRVPLTSPDGPQRSYLANANFATATALGHLLVVSMGHEVMAVDTLSRRDTGSQPLLWQQALIEPIPGMQAYHTVRPKRVAMAGRLARYRAEDSQGRPIGLIGPLLPKGLAFQQFDQLVCVDPLRGETLWMRRDIVPGSELLGDAQVLLVVPPEEDGGRAVEAIVLSPDDGTLLGTCTLPAEDPPEERVAALGRKLLLWHVGGAQARLRLVDPWRQTTVWTRTYERNAQPWLMDETRIGVMGPSGRFELVATDDGQPVLQAELQPEPELANIYLMGSRDHVMLITSRPSELRDEDEMISSLPGGFDHPMVTGCVYAFDLASGKMQWPGPATVRNVGLPLTQPAELPVLAFVQQKVRAGKDRRSVATLSVLCLDKRTGRSVFEAADLPRGAGVYSIVGEASRATVTLSLPSTTVMMSFTDEPTAPQPPYREDGGGSSASREDADFWGIVWAIPRALAKAAAARENEDVPGQPAVALPPALQERHDDD